MLVVLRAARGKVVVVVVMVLLMPASSSSSFPQAAKNHIKVRERKDVFGGRISSISSLVLYARKHSLFANTRTERENERKKKRYRWRRRVLLLVVVVMARAYVLDAF